MIKEFLKEGGIYTVANLLTKGVSLLLIPFYTAYFTPGDYGVLEIISLFGAFFNAIFSFQIYQGLGKYIGEDFNNISQRISLASTTLIFAICSFGLGLIISLLFQDQLLELLKLEKESLYTLQLAMCSLFLSGIFYHFGTHMRFLRMNFPFAIISIIHSLLNIGLTVVLVLWYDQGINGVFQAAIIVNPVILIIQAYVLRKEYRFQFDTSQLKRLFKFSYPLIPAALAYIFLNLTDRIFINDFLTKDDLGIYSIGSKFASIVSLVVFGFSSAFSPIIYSKYKDESIKPQVSFLFNSFWIIGLTAAFILSVFSYETLVVFTQREYYDAFQVMPILYFSVLMAGLGMFSPGLHLFSKTKIIAVIVISTALINIGLNYLLINQFELLGASTSTLICSILNFGTLFIISRKYYSFTINWKPLLQLLIILGLAALLLWYANHYIFATSFSQLIFKIIITITVLSIFIVTKILDIKKIVKSLR